MADFQYITPMAQKLTFKQASTKTKTKTKRYESNNNENGTLLIKTMGKRNFRLSTL